jgi:hypothetical protein
MQTTLSKNSITLEKHTELLEELNGNQSKMNNTQNYHGRLIEENNILLKKNHIMLQCFMSKFMTPEERSAILGLQTKIHSPPKAASLFFIGQNKNRYRQL